MKKKSKILHLFEGYGIELEYMIVDKETLQVLPVSDKIIEAASGQITGEILYEGLGWSNELVLHVLEMKTPGPAADLNKLPSLFQKGIQRANQFLEPLGGMLMPTAMHPFFNPDKETRLWPHDNKEIYEAYNRIFNCSGHGWSNLQSVHINLPFCGDQEFASLHASIRLILPLLPALAASSPIVEGKITGLADNRLDFYRKNQLKFPVITGKIIPEQAFSQKEYEQLVYTPIKNSIKPFDNDELLEPVWLNSRGAIARFDRNAIEIRLLDIQECPKSDIAIAAFITVLIRSLAEGFWKDLKTLKSFEPEPLLALLLKAMEKGEFALIENQDYLNFFRYPEKGKVNFKDFLLYLFETLKPHFKELNDFHTEIEFLLQKGTLSSRILSAFKKKPDPHEIKDIYRRLCDCLPENRFFDV